MLKWESVAPFGEPVVPLVNWMLIASSGSSAARQRVEPRALRRAGEREQLRDTTGSPAARGSSPSRTTCLQLRAGATLSQRFARALESISGAIVAAACRDSRSTLKRRAMTSALQPTLLSAYSSSDAR